MRLSKKQKMLLHTMASHAGVDEEPRRLIQANCGGQRSAASDRWTREGFIGVMRFYEDRSGGVLPGFTQYYWRGQDEEASPLDAMMHRVRTAAAAIGWSDADLDAFARGEHCSRGQYNGVSEMPGAFLGKVLDALLAIGRRRAKAGPRA